MYTDYTQKLKKQIEFDNLFEKCCSSTLGSSSHFLIARVILILSYSTGIKMDFIMSLKWSDILLIGSENEAVIKKELVVRKYSIPIHKKVAEFLSIFYKKLGYPPINSMILNLDLVENNNLKYIQPTNQSIFELGFPDYYKYVNGRDYFETLNFDTITQVVFGRKVFKVNGYSTKIAKKLKQHFELKTNEELYNFLGYNSKNEITYSISNINLTDGKGIKVDDNYQDYINYTKGIIELEDINFNTGHPFQKFNAFSQFLLNGGTHWSRPDINSTKILLLIGLFNGVRLSTLLKLNWSDIIFLDETIKTIYIKNSIVLEGKTINLGLEVNERLFNLLSKKMEILNEGELFRGKKGGFVYSNKPLLESKIFVTKNLNPLTQPSLLREIKKTLLFLKYPHYKSFTSKTTLIMYGRKIIEIKGDHKPTLIKLKEHFNFRTKGELFNFLYIKYDKLTDSYPFKGKSRNTIFDEIIYN